MREGRSKEESKGDKEGKKRKKKEGRILDG